MLNLDHDTSDTRCGVFPKCLRLQPQVVVKLHQSNYTNVNDPRVSPAHTGFFHNAIVSPVTFMSHSCRIDPPLVAHSLLKGRWISVGPGLRRPTQIRRPTPRKHQILGHRITSHGPPPPLSTEVTLSATPCGEEVDNPVN